MSVSTTQNRTEITLHHPEGSIRLAVPTDVPLVELIPDFLDVTGQPDDDGWVVSPDGANPYPSDKTIAELEVDGPPTALVLHELPATSPPAATGPEQPAATGHGASARR